MNSRKKKGDDYEMAVLNEIYRLLDSGLLPFPKDFVKVFHKKKYKGTAGNMIEVDISLEITRPGASIYSQLVIIECKDYTFPISTLRYNDLIKKMDYLHAQKGYLFTTSSFQQGVLMQGLLDHIGLVRFIPGTAPIFDAERCGLSPRDLFFREIEGGTDATSFLSLEAREAYTDFASFFFRQILEIDEDTIIPYLSDSKISNFANKIREMAGIGLDCAISDFDLIKIVTNIAKYMLTPHALRKEILGVCDFNNKRIILNSNLDVGTPRWRFTLAHEIGHALIHKRFFNQGFSSILSDSDANYITPSSRKRMEIQANQFASFLLMPSACFSMAYLDYRQNLHIPQRHYPRMYVDDQSVNLKDYHGILDKISRKFNVSQQVVERRLFLMNIIIDNRKIHLLGDEPPFPVINVP